MDCKRLNEIKKLVDIKLSEQFLQKSENDISIQVNNIVFEFASNKGDNYASDLFRATIEYTRSENEKKEKKSVIIKVEPLLEGAQKEIIKNSSLFSTEIMMMSDSLVKMNEFLNPGSPVSGRGLFVQTEPPLLVIEDLTPLGFRMADRTTGLNEEHATLAVRGLARFHASSVALCEKDQTQRNKYPYGLSHTNQSDGIKAFISQMTRNLSKEIVNWPEIDPKMLQKLMKLADNICEKGHIAALVHENEINVINHGDAWVNNMLFKYDDKKRPVDMIFVDFQLCVYSSPAIDLQYFFNTSLNDELLIEKEEDLLKEYLRTLTSTMSELGCRTKPPTMNELKKMYIDRAAIGMIATFVILPIILNDKTTKLNENELFSANESQNLIYRGAGFRRAFVRRLPKFDKLGLLD